MANEIPEVGDLYNFKVLTGYVLVQNRPFECRPVCHCEAKCNGIETVYRERVEKVIEWADNSIDVVSVTGRRSQLSAPSGDRCY